VAARDKCVVRWRSSCWRLFGALVKHLLAPWGRRRHYVIRRPLAPCPLVLLAGDVSHVRGAGNTRGRREAEGGNPDASKLLSAPGPASRLPPDTEPNRTPQGKKLHHTALPLSRRCPSFFCIAPRVRDFARPLLVSAYMAP